MKNDLRMSNCMFTDRRGVLVEESLADFAVRICEVFCNALGDCVLLQRNVARFFYTRVMRDARGCVLGLCDWCLSK